MIINIGDDILRLQSLKLLKKLLVDKTTKKNIMWATDAYKGKSGEYERNKEMTEALITGRNADVIKTRRARRWSSNRNAPSSTPRCSRRFGSCRR